MAGGSIEAPLPEDSLPTGDVTVVVRPENATLSAVQKGALSGVVENIVYFGTDTHVHLKLDDGSMFIVRQQNASSSSTAAQKGKRFGLYIAPETPRVLKD